MFPTANSGVTAQQGFPWGLRTACARLLRGFGVGPARIDPGKPWQNGTKETFNGRFRERRPSVEWFRNRTEATVVIEAWRAHYSTVRPHSRPDYLTPEQFEQRHRGSSIQGAGPS